MQENVDALLGTPWVYALITLSVLLDIWLPVLPSGVLVIAAATAVAGTTAAEAAEVAGTAGAAGAARAAEAATHLPEMLALVLCAATASVLGDLLVYRLAWRGGSWFERAVARSRRLTVAQERLGQALVRGGGALVVLARFAPAGRSVVSLTAGAAHRRAKEFVPWSALAGLAWAAYSVGLGWFGSQWMGATWMGAAVSVLALFAAGSLAAYVIRRSPAAAPTAGTTVPAPAGPAAVESRPAHTHPGAPTGAAGPAGAPARRG
ncbi:VTT domain-containing protein [Streptomyces sp. DSM 42041]|uniref:VTT domain-containing protein n=1 Tax=Streptomyces hazeniae TaxID=3075538 RepID=A0ABU2NJM7_9ACTN|nr:VTT domain-containing protein [Streptomyces sp. DSM 42041]MDT0377187.1 VTT domain-containing protein [Streptomyces sp. DSM 42041]